MSAANGPKFAPFAFASTTDITPPPYYNKPAGEKNGMHYVRFGTTGAVVSRICLGLMSYAQVNPGEALPRPWTIAQQEAEPFIQQALDAGITFYDTVSLMPAASLSPLSVLLLCAAAHVVATTAAAPCAG
jgi:hypothetical protein